jgi:hypothetical protein
MSEERSALLWVKGETVASLTPESGTGRHELVSVCVCVCVCQVITINVQCRQNNKTTVSSITLNTVTVLLYS